jgi:hypothetical protein
MLLSSAPVQYSSYIIHVSQIGEERTEIGQLRIVRIVEPATNRNGIVWVEDV